MNNASEQTRIPLIMASNPPDARDLCVPLVKELLTVANAFNIEVRTVCGSSEQTP